MLTITQEMLALEQVAQVHCLPKQYNQIIIESLFKVMIMISGGTVEISV